MQHQHGAPSAVAVCQYLNIMLLCLPPDCSCVVGTGASQQQLEQLSAQLPKVQQRQANGQVGPEGSLKWLDGEPVEQWQLRRLVGLPSVWTVHDLIWNQQVCCAGRICCQQLLTSQGVR
jgi:hypothetical protein